jgi:hypothetical protein
MVRPPTDDVEHPRKNPLEPDTELDRRNVISQSGKKLPVIQNLNEKWSESKERELQAQRVKSVVCQPYLVFTYRAR